jgi:hypothetical protein
MLDASPESSDTTIKRAVAANITTFRPHMSEKFVHTGPEAVFASTYAAPTQMSPVVE